MNAPTFSVILSVHAAQGKSFRARIFMPCMPPNLQTLGASSGFQGRIHSDKPTTFGNQIRPYEINTSKICLHIRKSNSFLAGHRIYDYMVHVAVIQGQSWLNTFSSECLGSAQNVQYLFLLKVFLTKLEKESFSVP